MKKNVVKQQEKNCREKNCGKKEDVGNEGLFLRLLTPSYCKSHIMRM
jgi:hypothetical protein